MALVRAAFHIAFQIPGTVKSRSKSRGSLLARDVGALPEVLPMSIVHMLCVGLFCCQGGYPLVFLTGGRPGIFLWVSADAGESWTKFNIAEQHNKHVTTSPAVRDLTYCRPSRRVEWIHRVLLLHHLASHQC